MRGKLQKSKTFRNTIAVSVDNKKTAEKLVESLIFLCGLKSLTTEATLTMTKQKVYMKLE